MENFFHGGIQSSYFDLSWCDDDQAGIAALVKTSSAFIPYTEIPANQLRNGDGRSLQNMNKRVIGFLRKGLARPGDAAKFDRQRGFRHMMSERSRREKQKQGYSALLSRLPQGTKNDKNSIVQAGVKEIQQLSREREELLRRNREMNGTGDLVRTGTNIKVTVANPTSGIDSVLEVLKCLQNLGVKTTAIRTEFSAGEISTIIEIENEIEAAEVEKVIQSALHEAERKLLSRTQQR